MTDEQERAYTVSLDTEDARLLSELLEGVAAEIGQTTGGAERRGHLWSQCMWLAARLAKVTEPSSFPLTFEETRLALIVVSAAAGAHRRGVPVFSRERALRLVSRFKASADDTDAGEPE